VRAACRGTVSFAGSAGTSGRTVSVECGGYTASYLHLSSIAVERGDRLRRGEPIGEAGTTGRPRLREPHLYFGVRRTGERWAYIDPLSLLPRLAGGPPPPVPALERRRPPSAPLGPAPRAAPVGRTAPVGRDAPLGRAAPVGRAAPALPLAAWVGLAALAAALAATPLARARRRARRARRIAPAAESA
jgi:hypothetical protein